MFKAVRDSALKFEGKIGTAWNDMRGQGIVRLFVFEFSVVLLGVLAAQGLQSWANDASARERVEASKSRVDEAIRINIASAQAWNVAIPCFRTRLEEIMLYAGQGRTVPSQLLARPEVFGTAPAAFGDAEELLLRQMLGDEVAYRYGEIESDRGSLERGAEVTLEKWLTLAVLDPALGDVSAGDRVNARHDAAEMLSALRRIEIVSGKMIAWAERNNVEPYFGGGRLPRNCDDIWTSGTMLLES